MSVDTTTQSMEVKRILARVTKIIGLEAIVQADRIELATVLGWQVVVKKNEFQVDDLVVYFAIDSVLDATNPEFEFLQGKRLKTKRMRGEISQGLVMPLSIVTHYGLRPEELKEDDDLTEALKVLKYVFDSEEKSTTTSRLPPGVKKTGEHRVQDCHKMIKNLRGQDVIITEKEDGTSTTYAAINDEFFICSHGRVCDPTDNSCKPYYSMEQQFRVGAQLLSLKRNLAIQGEIIGPSINGNTMKLKALDFRVFYIWSIDEQRKLLYDECVQIVTAMGLKMVPLLYRGPFKQEWSQIKSLLAYAESFEYAPNLPAEGIVVSTDCKTYEEPQNSFKVISNTFLLKWGR